MLERKNSDMQASPHRSSLRLQRLFQAAAFLWRWSPFRAIVGCRHGMWTFPAQNSPTGSNKSIKQFIEGVCQKLRAFQACERSVCASTFVTKRLQTVVVRAVEKVYRQSQAKDELQPCGKLLVPRGEGLGGRALPGLAAPRSDVLLQQHEQLHARTERGGGECAGGNQERKRGHDARAHVPPCIPSATGLHWPSEHLAGSPAPYHRHPNSFYTTLLRRLAA